MPQLDCLLSGQAVWVCTSRAAISSIAFWVYSSWLLTFLRSLTQLPLQDRNKNMLIQPKGLPLLQFNPFCSEIWLSPLFGCFFGRVSEELICYAETQSRGLECTNTQHGYLVGGRDLPGLLCSLPVV